MAADALERSRPHAGVGQAAHADSHAGSRLGRFSSSRGRLAVTGAGSFPFAAYVSAPTFIVFGPLVLTDIAMTLFCLLTLWRFADLWQEPTRKNVVSSGCAWPELCSTKFSSGLLFFAFGVFALSTRFLALPGAPQGKPELRAWRRLRWRWTWKGILLAAILVYCFYFFFSLNQSTDALYLVGRGAAWVPVRRLLMPPWLYLRGLLLFRAHLQPPDFHSRPRIPSRRLVLFPRSFCC